MTKNNTLDREFHYTRKHFDFLRKISNQQTGIVVTDDKFDMFYSRLSRRLRALGLKDFDAYCKYVKNNPDKEMTELVNAVTTNLTSFFREKHHFDYLQNTIIPEFIQQNAPGSVMNIWCSASSTGEEPYSIAMTINESNLLSSGYDYQLVSTDIDSNVLQTAAQGIYSVSRIEGLDKKLVRKYFQRGKGTNQGKVRFKSIYKRQLSFGLLNLIENTNKWLVKPPLDIIFCRNVLIYFDRDTKLSVVEKFSQILKPGGYLIIGHSESLFRLTDKFELIGQTIYRKVK